MRADFRDYYQASVDGKLEILGLNSLGIYYKNI